jgi:hypothetical protein
MSAPAKLSEMVAVSLALSVLASPDSLLRGESDWCLDRLAFFMSRSDNFVMCDRVSVQSKGALRFDTLHRPNGLKGNCTYRSGYNFKPKKLYGTAARNRRDHCPTYRILDPLREGRSQLTSKF